MLIQLTSLCHIPCASLRIPENMNSTLASSRVPRSSDWAKMKPHIAELYKVRQLPLKAVMKEIEDKYAFTAK